MIRQHFWILPMCLWTRAAVLMNSILPPAAGRCGPQISRTDAFLDHRLAAMSVRNSTAAFRRKWGCNRWPRPQPAGGPKLALAQPENKADLNYIIISIIYESRFYSEGPPFRKKAIAPISPVSCDLSASLQ
jgi:hypothetical protein